MPPTPHDIHEHHTGVVHDFIYDPYDYAVDVVIHNDAAWVRRNRATPVRHNDTPPYHFNNADPARVIFRF